MGVRVLLIEDDETIAEPLAEGLGHFGLTVDRVSTGTDGLRGPYGDVVLLDLGLPDMDGIDVCRGIRQVSDVPIIILSARGEEADRVLGLELGADDYLAKPFSLRELVARVRAVTRRTQQGRGAQQGFTQQGLAGPEFAGTPEPGPSGAGPSGAGPLGAGPFGPRARGAGRLDAGPLAAGPRVTMPFDAVTRAVGTPGEGAPGAGAGAAGTLGVGVYDSGSPGAAPSGSRPRAAGPGSGRGPGPRPGEAEPFAGESFGGESFGGESFAGGPTVVSPMPPSYEPSVSSVRSVPAEPTRAPSAYERPDVTRHFESPGSFEAGPPYEANRPVEPEPAAEPAADSIAGPGPLVVDRRTRQVWVGDSPVSLTPKEFELLALLTEDPGAVYSRQQILDRVWDPHYQGPTKTLDVHVATLRRKLGNSAWIQTLRGVGFRLAVQSRPPSAGGPGGPYGERPGGSYGEQPSGAYGSYGDRPSRPFEDDLPSGGYAASERPAAFR